MYAGVGHLNKSVFRGQLRQPCVECLIQFDAPSLGILLPEGYYESKQLDMQESTNSKYLCIHQYRGTHVT